MLFELRVTVDDRPGSLAQLTQLLAQHSIDVREVDILGSVVGKAVDVLHVECTTEQAEALRPAIFLLPGFELLSLRPANTMRSDNPELDLLMTLGKPGSVQRFTEAAVPAFGADWAMAFPVSRGPAAECVTRGAPPLTWNGWTPQRATRVLPGVYSASAPFAGMHAVLGTRHVLLLGRTAGPDFHDLEVMRFNRLIEVAATILGVPFTAGYAAGGGTTAGVATR